MATDGPPAPSSPLHKECAITWCGDTLPALRRTFEGQQQTAATWSTAIRQAALQLGAEAGETHLVLIDQSGTFAAEHELAGGAFTLDVIAGAPNAGWESRCQASGGRYQVAANAEDAARQLAKLNRYWQAGYEVTYPAGSAIDSVEIYSEWGYGVFAGEGAARAGTKMVGAQGLEPRASSV